MYIEKLRECIWLQIWIALYFYLTDNVINHGEFPDFQIFSSPRQVHVFNISDMFNVELKSAVREAAGKFSHGELDDFGKALGKEEEDINKI